MSLFILDPCQHDANVKYQSDDYVNLQDVTRLVHDTWEQEHVSLGRDARNIQHTRIEVIEVRLVVNLNRLSEYQLKRSQLLCHSSRIKAFPGSQPVKTSTVGTLMCLSLFRQLQGHTFSQCIDLP